MKHHTIPTLVCAAFVSLLSATEILAGCSTYALDTLESPDPQSIGGQTRLCIDGSRLKASLMAERLEPGSVYSAWWVYFDDVTQCLQPSACGPRDLSEPQGGNRQTLPDGSYAGGDLPRGVIGRMASGVAWPSGRLTLTGELRRFEFDKESELWLLLMSHGPAVRTSATQLARQLLTPEMPVLGEPFMGRAEDGWRSQWNAINVFRYRDLVPEGGRR